MRFIFGDSYLSSDIEKWSKQIVLGVKDIRIATNRDL
jgi:hypothetical protein